MNKVEQILTEQKAAFDQVQAPLELENRLRNALRRSSARRKTKEKFSAKVLVASLVLFILVGLNFETLAYYGKKLVGYDQVMNGTLQQLNQLGKGQLIEESYTFKNGVEVTLDGVMLDDTQLIVFLTEKDPQGEVDALNLGPFMYIQGLYKRYNMESGQGNCNPDNTEIKWIYSFEPPLFFEKTLRLKFDLENNGEMEEGEIVFNLERDKAVGRTLHLSLNESFTAHNEQIKLASLWASPTQTILEGSIQSATSLAKDYLVGERIRPVALNIMANGQELTPLGGGTSTDLKGITFHHNYDALPQDLKSLQIIIGSFSADHDVNQQFVLLKGQEAKDLQVQGQDIQVNSVEESAGNTLVTITTQEGTVLSKVKLLVNGKAVSLEETIADKYEKTSEGKIFHTRTLVFPAQGQTLELDIQSMTYLEDYQHVIEVPVK